MANSTSIRKAFDESNQHTAHFDMYPVKKSSAKVLMTVLYGDTGQAAQTDVYLEGGQPDKGIIGSIEDYDLGTNSSLNGKFLDVYAAVTDVSKTSDLTSIEFRLEGGVGPYRYAMQKTVQQQGSTVLYKMSIFFTND